MLRAASRGMGAGCLESFVEGFQPPGFAEDFRQLAPNPAIWALMTTTHALEHAPDAATPTHEEPSHEEPSTAPTTATDPLQMLAGLEQKHAGGSKRSQTSSHKEAKTDDGSATTARLIVANLRAAQHALDETPKGARIPDARHQMDTAGTHLLHALKALERLRVLPPTVTAAADNLAESVSRFHERNEDSRGLYMLTDEHKLMWTAYVAVRNKLGRPVNQQHKPPGYKRETRSDADYVRAALPEALDLVAHDATQLLAVLEHTTPQNRMATLAKSEGPVLASSAQASWLAPQLPAKDHAKFHAHSNRAADRVLDVMMWFHDRPGNDEERHFQRG